MCSEINIKSVLFIPQGNNLLAISTPMTFWGQVVPETHLIILVICHRCHRAIIAASRHE